MCVATSAAGVRGKGARGAGTEEGRRGEKMQKGAREDAAEARSLCSPPLAPATRSPSKAGNYRELVFYGSSPPASLGKVRRMIPL